MSDDVVRRAPKPRRRWIWVGVGLASAMLLLTATARFVSMHAAAGGSTLPEDLESLPYVEHLPLALLHLVGGLVFTVLGPLQLSTRVRARWPRWHRWSGRVFVACALGIGVSGVVMNEVFPNAVGGMLRYTGAHLFGVAMIVALVLGTVAILRKRVTQHRAWMVRAYAIGLGVGTQRLIIIPLFLWFGGVDDLTVGLGMWGGWLVTLLGAELVIRGSRRPKPVAVPALG